MRLIRNKLVLVLGCASMMNALGWNPADPVAAALLNLLRFSPPPLAAKADGRESGP